MSEKIPSKADALRAMREANYAANHSRGDGLRVTTSRQAKERPDQPTDVGVAPSPREAKSKARSSVVEPAAHNGLVIGSDPVVPTKPKPGRPRLGEERSKPWLHTNPPMSKTTWYRRKAEGKLPCDGPVSTTGKS